MPGKYNDYRNQFQRENYDRLNVPVAKGTVAALKEYAKPMTDIAIISAH